MKQPDKLSFDYMMACYNAYHRRKAEIIETISDEDEMFWVHVPDLENEAVIKEHIRFISI